MANVLRRARTERGISLLEITLTIVIAGVVGAMGTAQLVNARRAMQGDGAMRIVMGQLVAAQQMAVGQRRNIEVQFNNGNWVKVVRHEVGGGTTTLANVALEGGVRFSRISGVPDTPDGFGNGADVAFGTALQIVFSSDGTLVDQTGNPLNGTVFLSTAGANRSFRAVTILGVTGRVRGYRWTGAGWTRV